MDHRSRLCYCHCDPDHRFRCALQTGLTPQDGGGRPSSTVPNGFSGSCSIELDWWPCGHGRCRPCCNCAGLRLKKEAGYGNDTDLYHRNRYRRNFYRVQTIVSRIPVCVPTQTPVSDFCWLQSELPTSSGNSSLLEQNGTPSTRSDLNSSGEFFKEHSRLGLKRRSRGCRVDRFPVVLHTDNSPAF
jgi:hypothetical protein